MEIDQEYELVPLNGDEDIIKPHPKNPNQGYDTVVEESVDVNGWYGVITCQRSTGYILAGHTRWRVALKKGAAEIPVVWKDVDDTTALKIMLADNETARQAEMNEAKLEEILAGLETLDGTGFVFASAQEKLESEASEEEDAAATPVAEPLDPDAIPDDEYTPEFGVMIVCRDEEDQAFVYDRVQHQWAVPGSNGGGNRTVRVVAV